MLRHEKGQIAANEIAVEARLVELARKARYEVNTVADAAPSRRRQITVKRHHPLQDLILMASATLAQFTNDLVKVPALDTPFEDVSDYGKLWRWSLTTRAPFVPPACPFLAQGAFGRCKGFVDQCLRLRVERFGSMRHIDRDMNARGDQCWWIELVARGRVGKDTIHSSGVG